LHWRLSYLHAWTRLFDFEQRHGLEIHRMFHRRNGAVGIYRSGFYLDWREQYTLRKACLRQRHADYNRERSRRFSTVPLRPARCAELLRGIQGDTETPSSMRRRLYHVAPVVSECYQEEARG
jgi:hypothetical protein